ncbi:uncharacterized protein C6orf47 homolog [Chanos chanos]|uniref:Uncharacterized protein C6orf47 homolog n=1 Tax=Chanos chanos TaxID=29144 RepID=A0A6J2WIG6_CHACN|nr:uncharacterized protein C6orf47 homolog [Chanos chanos]
MTAVVGRVWAWVSPAISYRPWASKAKPVKTVTDEGQMKGRWGFWGLTSWVWGEQKKQIDQTALTEEYWEAEEEILKPLKIEELSASSEETEVYAPAAQGASRWWNRMLPSTYWPWTRSTNSSGLGQRKCAGWSEGTWDTDTNDGEYSDYDTPPPSPTPASKQSSTFQYFARSWTGEVLPEHYEICFNFLRHLFDLFVVGFLWTVSPPAKFILDVLGIQGALKLWLHGMAMFFVTAVGMAGLLWLVQEYLLQFALVYGIFQALVISVSVRQSVITGDGEEEKDERDEKESSEEKCSERERDQVQQTKD